MKPDWEVKKLTDIAKVKTGKWDANHANTNGAYLFYTCAYTQSKCDTKRFSGECIILPGNGVNVGEVFYYSGDFDAYQRTYVLSEIQIMPRYLYYHMIFNWKDIGVKKQYGSATNFIKIGNFHDYKVSYPSFPEQKQIVEILDKVFALIDRAKANTEKNLQNARELFQSELDRIFSQKGDDWEEKKLGEILKLEYGKPIDKNVRKFNGLYPIYGANGIIGRTDHFYHEKKTIIIGRKGSAGVLNLAEEKFWPLDVTYYVVYNDDRYSLMFLYYLLSAIELPNYAKGVKPGINRNDVYNISVSIPLLLEQKQIVEILDKLSAETQKLEAIYQKKLSYLEELKKSILDKAFRGELTE